MTVTDRTGEANACDIEPFLGEISGDLLAYFSRRVWPVDEAADCLSETLLVLWRRRKDLPVEADDRRAWAFGAARRVLANFRRGAVRRLALSDRLRESLTTSVVPGIADDGVADAIAELRESDRELITLVLWDGFGVAEAGAVLGLRPTTARTRFSRAKARLRRLLE
jgi:RNA polymerase sigma-70 factor (ECF subfamily)